MAQTPTPKGPDHYTYAVLGDAEFEELCHLVVADTHPEAQRLRAPDGGLDIVLMKDGVVERGWQVKRFTGNVQWGQCVESLDTAVIRHAPQRVTFCFARDLTEPQKATFARKLVGRHPGVSVDFWAASHLTAGILRAPNGRQIARRFFEPADTAEELLRTVRAGGPIGSLDAVGDRIGSLAEAVGADDPHFAYDLTAGPGVPGQPPHPAAAMSMGGVGPDGPFRIDALARHARQFSVQVHLDRDENSPERRTLTALLRHGGEAHFPEGLSFRFEGGPEVFAREIERLRGGAWTIRSRPVAKPWPATLRAREASGAAVTFPLDLRPMDEPPPGCTFGFFGARGGLGMVIGVSWTLPDGPGSMGMRWTFTLGGHSIDDQRSAIRFLEAMCDSGAIELLDRAGERPNVPGRGVVTSDEDRELLTALADLLEDLALIESWSEQPLLVPAVVSQEDAVVLWEAARLIRDGGAWVQVGDWTVEGLREEVRTLVASPPPDAMVHLPHRIQLAGRELDLGWLMCPVMPARILSEEAIPDRPGDVRLRVRPLGEGSVRALARRPGLLAA